MSVPSMELSLFTATVHARDGVLLEVAADSGYELVRQVAGFVRERCAHVLWPDDASQVCRLLDDRNAFAAIALYFARVGQRWDEEWLELSLPDNEAEHGPQTQTVLPVTYAKTSGNGDEGDTRGLIRRHAGR